jgi:hypothetical protein
MADSVADLGQGVEDGGDRARRRMKDEGKTADSGQQLAGVDKVEMG